MSTFNSEIDMFEEADTFELAHHAVDVPFIPNDENVGLYSVFGQTGLETVDMQRMASDINLYMGLAIAGEMLLTSGSLGGLMTGIAVTSMVPSVMQLCVCMSLMNIELNISSPIFSALKTNRKNLYTPLEEDFETFRIKPIDDGVLDSYRYEHPLLGSSLSAFLPALLIFDDALNIKNDENPDQISSYDIWLNALNITHALNFNAITVPAYHTNSMAWAVCSWSLNIYSCDRLSAGLGGQAFTYQHYIKNTDYRINNTFFCDLLPTKLSATYKTTDINSYSVLLARMAFVSGYSSLDLYISASEYQRELSKADDSVVEFSRYILEYTNTDDEMMKKLGFDSIDLIIRNKCNEGTDLEIPEYTKVYNVLLDLANDYKVLYNKVLVMQRKCPFQIIVTDIENCNKFWNSVPDLPSDIKIPDAIKGVNGETKLLHYSENNDPNWARLLANTMGNRIAIGMKIVPWWKYNYNTVGFDYYIKLHCNNEVMQSSRDIADIINITPSGSYTYNGDLESLERIFKGRVGSTSDEKVTDVETKKSLEPLIEFSLKIGEYLKSYQSRAKLEKDI